MSSSGLVAVDGATGYVGTHLVQVLRAAGMPVRCLVRKGSHAEDRALLESLGAELVETDLTAGADEVTRALSGAACAVHLIGSIAPRKGESLEDLHAGQANAMAQSARAAGVERFVMVTALGTAADAASVYHRTKWQAEEKVRAVFANHVIVRPSLIIGRQVGRRDSKLMARYRQLIAERPTVPMINGGNNLLQPVFITDLAQALTAACQGLGQGQTIEIGGPEVIKMRNLVTQLMGVLGTRKRILGLPAGLVGLGAGILEKVQEVPLVSRDQVTLACTNNICSDNGLQKIFGIKPTPVSVSLATYAPSAAACAAASRC